MNKFKGELQHNNNNNNNNGGLVHRGGRESSIPAISHDTLRDGRKGDPQQNVVGKKGVILQRG